MADITPTMTGYIRMLYCVIESSTSKEDVAWCKDELKRVMGCEEE